MSVVKINCPMPDCAFTLVESMPDVSAGALANVFGPGVVAQVAVNEHMAHIEELLERHVYGEHKPIEWVIGVSSLAAENKRLVIQLEQHHTTEQCEHCLG